MVPTSAEKEWLKDYLYQAFTYRESFNEAYDHILLGLEHKERKPFFEANVMEIIDEDFGGSTHMLNMELQYKSITDSDFQSAYFRLLLSWLKMPRLAYTVAIFAMSLFIVFVIKNKAVIIGFLIFSFVVSVLIPLAFLALRSFKSKPSIKDSAFKWLIWGFFLINWAIAGPAFKVLNYLLTMAIYHKSPKAYPNNPVNYSIGTIGFTIVVLHVLTLIKIHRERFRTKMIAAK